MGNIDRIKSVAKQVAEHHSNDNQIVVVVSAMSGETNRLISLAQKLQTYPNLREMDALLSTGEQVTIALLAIALNTIGKESVSLTGWQAGITTNSIFGKARIESINTQQIQNILNQNKILIIAGFQGIDKNNNITTLGRGGSDTSAVALAAALNADECQIYTDVDGVYTTDPRIEPKAKRMQQITYEEMLEMASLGAKVLQIRSVEFAAKYKIKLRVLSSMQKGTGTLITSEENIMEKPLISGIAFTKDEAKITLFNVPDQPGVAYQILGPIADANIDIDMIIQNQKSKDTTDFTFTLLRNSKELAINILEKNKNTLKYEALLTDDKIAKISLVGVGMKSHAGIASKMFQTLANNDINIMMISTSEIKISVIIAEDKLEQAVQILHSAFELDKPTITQK